MFAETGLSPGEISSLFVLWSVTAFALEVPSGLWADIFSRRRLLTLAPLVVASGYALWTFVPSYPSFAVGFVLWGAGGAMRSGTLQALAYEELDRVGAAGSYARLIGRSQAAGTTAVMAASAVAGPVLAAGGYRAAGIASVAVPVVQAAIGWSFPESRSRGVGDGEASFSSVLRDGVARVRAEPMVRRLLLLVSVLMGVTALDEYLPLLAGSTGVSAAAVPVLVLVVTVGETVGGWLAGRAVRAAGPALAVAAVCLAAGAATGRPEGFVLIAVAFGLFRWSIAAAEARLQEHLDDGSRATVTSMAGFGAEVLAVLVYAGYGLGAGWAGHQVLFVIAAVPYLVLAVVLRR